MKLPLIIPWLVFAVFVQTTAAREDEGKSASYPMGDVSHWLPLVKSFHLRAEIRDERTPEGIAKELRQLKSQFADLKDPDPLDFTQLQPVSHELVEIDFDQTRLRSLSISRTAQDCDLSRNLRIWDGKRALLHDQYFRSKQDAFRLADKPDLIVEGVFGWVAYLNAQAPMLWWNKTPEAEKAFQQQRGKPTDFIVVDRETYHGVDCHVLLSSVGNQSNRYYVGAADGRWYGAKDGIIAIPDLPATDRTYKLAIEDFLGKKFGENAADAVIAEVAASLRSLSQDKKTVWCRLFYSRLAKHYAPCFEYWFSDFRDLGNGRFFPYREEFQFYDHEGQEIIFLAKTRMLTVKEIALDRPLGDHLFQEELTGGAMIVDEIHQPPLYYKHKAKFTPDEWQAILKDGKDRDADDATHRKKVEQLIGKVAPPLPTGDWLNSKPLTWADLRGKIVVLKFWAIGCGPCYNELSALHGPASDKKDSEPPDKKDSKTPVVFIGVHSRGNSKEEIEEVVNRLKLGAPICIDRNASGNDGLGDFFTQCEVDRMPTTVAIDEEGRILAHGFFTAASRRGRTNSEKK